jgi:hypothetical protein
MSEIIFSMEIGRYVNEAFPIAVLTAMQDAYDILTGAWVAKKGGIPLLTDTRPLLMRAVSLRVSRARLTRADALRLRLCSYYDPCSPHTSPYLR